MSMATSTVGKVEAKVEKAEDMEEGRVTRVEEADTGLLISSSNRIETLSKPSPKSTLDKSSPAFRLLHLKLRDSNP